MVPWLRPSEPVNPSRGLPPIPASRFAGPPKPWRRLVRRKDRSGTLKAVTAYPERRDQVGPTRSGTSNALKTPIGSIRTTNRSRSDSNSFISLPKSVTCRS
jgi:hypothetical protein